jgi:hypothetical protein
MENPLISGLHCSLLEELPQKTSPMAEFGNLFFRQESEFGNTIDRSM